MEIIEKFKAFKTLFVILIVILCAFIFQQQNSASDIQIVGLKAEGTLDETNLEEENLTEETSKAPIIYVDIKGAVKYPGVYQLEAGSRVIDIIEVAGGLLNEADETNLNQAMLLTDQMMIYVPIEGEQVNQDIPTLFDESQVHKININTADVGQLVSLPGIGVKKAEAIIQYRKDNGSFQTIEDLKEVSGIGDKIFEQLKEQVSIQ